jgi:hypothetical protein
MSPIVAMDYLLTWTTLSIRDRKRVELSNDSIRFDSIQSNWIESNWNFEKVGRIESSRIQNESNRIESNSILLIRVISDFFRTKKYDEYILFDWLIHYIIERDKNERTYIFSPLSVRINRLYFSHFWSFHNLIRALH